jgi:hypothetical protein
MALVPVTDELLDDTNALSTYLRHFPSRSKASSSMATAKSLGRACG